jgi:hypothetical protein
VHPDGRPAGSFLGWERANASRAAWLRYGKLVFIDGPLGGRPISVNDTVFWFHGPHEIGYGHLRSLPHDPRALERCLASDRLGHGPSIPSKAFGRASDLLSDYALPPWFEANLFRAVGLIPGVRVYSHFVDSIGRPGTGFLFSLGTGYQMAIVLDPHTFRYRSSEDIDPHPSGQQIRLTGPVCLRVQQVSGPGVIPVSGRRSGAR